MTPADPEPLPGQMTVEEVIAEAERQRLEAEAEPLTVRFDKDRPAIHPGVSPLADLDTTDEAQKTTKPEPRPLTAREVVARRLKENP